jgi:RNA polymerase sigma factor (sigma-70 family)
MDDLEFVQRCTSGEKSAWDEFLNKYSRLIYSYIKNILNSQGYTLTENDIHDVFQEIICMLIKDNYRKLASFKAKNGCSLASWLRQVTVNFTIDYVRKIKPAFSIDEESDDEYSLKDKLCDNSPNVTEILTKKELSNSLKECVEKLDTDDKYFLELYLNKNLKLEELRGILNISRPAVDMRKTRILNRLKKCFQDKGLLLDF